MTNYEILKEYEVHHTPVPSYDEWEQLKEYERTVTSYNMKPIDYDIACETVTKLLDKRKALKEENAQLKEHINHLLKTQARQFVDNQKLQIKAEKAKDVVNIDTARQIKQIKELLKECKPYINQSANSRMLKNSVGFKKDTKLLTKIDEVLK